MGSEATYIVCVKNKKQKQKQNQNSFERLAVNASKELWGHYKVEGKRR